jgi:hypothetical protein
MARPDMGWQRTATAPDSSGGLCAWDPIKKQIVLKMTRSVGAYFPDEDRWEKWPIAIDGCCDYQSAMALDVAGRWMYVLGDGVAERYHLDEKRAEDLRNRPWGGGTTAAFGARNFRGGYASMGLTWHPRTRQIVMVLYGSPWVDQRPGIGDGSKAVYLIDPATNKVSFVRMGGQVPADPGIFGMYGRFRVVSGADSIVSAYLADRNASIATIPFAQAVQIAPIILNQGQTP